MCKSCASVESSDSQTTSTMASTAPSTASSSIIKSSTPIHSLSPIPPRQLDHSSIPRTRSLKWTSPFS